MPDLTYTEPFANCLRVLGFPITQFQKEQLEYFDLMRKKIKLRKQLKPSTPEWVIDTMVKLSYVRDGWEI